MRPPQALIIALKAAATADDRGALHAALTDAEDWLYGEGEGETAAAFSARLATLRGAAEPVFLRARERARCRRPAAADAWRIAQAAE